MPLVLKIFNDPKLLNGSVDFSSLGIRIELISNLRSYCLLVFFPLGRGWGCCGTHKVG